jgi:hypothetical protein
MRRALALTLMLFTLLSCAAYAQQYSGTINGSVTDASGAAIGAAAVTATNVGTAATYNATTSDQGVFTFAQLPVGTYDVTVKKSSFKEFIAKRVEVHTSTNTEVSAKLEVGSATETITVEATNVQVETTDASVGEVVQGTQVRELPLNGENFMGLVVLSPGVSQANDFNGRDKGLGGGSDFSVNGNPYTNNLFLVDGVNNNDVGSNRTILVYPSVDAIAEFKMVRNSYGPEYGQASGAIISITTKSGENRFHGGFFYAGRNDALDANDWFSNHSADPAQRTKAELRRHDWGYNFSGPIVKNKLFFFWNQEWNREIRGQSVSACVPTVAEKTGDFSQGLSCGATAPTIPVGLQAPGNPLKFANPDSAGLLLAQFYPDPNVPGATGNDTNWRLQENTKPAWSEWNIRTDYDITSKHRATFRWTQDSWKSPGPNPNLFWGDSIFPTVNSDWSQPSKSVMGKLTSQLGSSMVNDVEFGYGHNAIVTTLSGTNSGLVAQVNAAIPTAWPTQKDKGAFINGGAAWGGLAPYGSGQTMWNIAPYGNHEDLYALQDNLSKVRGNHLFKVGAYYSTNAKVEDNNGGTDQPAFPTGDGSVSIKTTNQLANLLAPGQLFNSTENSINATDNRHWHDFEWYVGDTWKVNRRLSLSYGFRWSFYRETYSDKNMQASFSLAAYDKNGSPQDACNGVIIVPGTHPCQDAAAQLALLGISLPLSNGTPGPNSALVNNNNHNIAPRIGVAWDLWGNGKTAIRFGIGQFFQRELVGPARSLAGTAPFVISATDVRTLEVAAPLSSPSVSPNAAKDPRGVTPNSWQWNASVEQELARNTTLTVAYVGNAGVHLTSMLDLNRVPRADWANAAFLGSNGANASVTNIDSYRAAANFGTIGEFARSGHASYHSLQTLFRSRVGNRSNFQMSYTWSHSIGDVELDNSSGSVNQQAFIDPSNTSLDKGNTNINRPHIFVANEVFDLPKFTGSNAFVQQALGGWSINSIINIQSGASLSVFSNGASDANSSVNPMQIPGAGLCGDPLVIPGASFSNCYQLTSLTGTGFGNNHRPNATGVACNSGQSGDQLLNPAAFTLVGYQIGTVGTARRGSCSGATNRSFDLQFAKNWKFRERYGLKFSLDFFNVFNHANFKSSNLEGTGYSASNVTCGANACSPLNNVITSQSTPGSNWGQANAVQPGRELQYTLRFTF